MPVTFTREIPQDSPYPAFNDSWVSFYESGMQYADIYVAPFDFPDPLRIYPDPSGRCNFNFKEIAKLYFNGIPENTTTPTAWFETINARIQELRVTIRTNSHTSGDPTTPTTNDIGSKVTYLPTQIYYTPRFSWSVKQLGEKIFNNPYQLLFPSENGVDYNMSYWEGYPHTFALQETTAGSDIILLNRNTSDMVTFNPAISKQSCRIWVDKSYENLTTESILPLTDTVNRLEIYKDGVFKTNLNLKKNKPKCGQYLRWWNNHGDWSYFLFDAPHRDIIKTKSLGELTRNQTKNIGEPFVQSPTYNIGKETSVEKRIQATVSKDELFYLKEIQYSPCVQLYSSTEPYIEGTWSNVNISGTINNRTKRQFEEINLTITLPEQNTMTY